MLAWVSMTRQDDPRMHALYGTFGLDYQCEGVSVIEGGQ